MTALSDALIDPRTGQFGCINPDVGKADVEACSFRLAHEGQRAATGESGLDAEAFAVIDQRVAPLDCEPSSANDVDAATRRIKFLGDFVGVDIGNVAPEHVVKKGCLAGTVGSGEDPQDRRHQADRRAAVAEPRSILTVSMRPSGYLRITWPAGVSFSR